MRIRTLLFAVCIVPLLVSCGSPTTPATEPSETAPEAARTFRIAFSQCNSAEPYRSTQNAILRREIAKYPDCELVIQDAQQDNAKQIDQIDTFILQGVDLLIVAPNEAGPLTPVVRKAQGAGIKVICLERNLLEPVYDIFVGADNVAIGEMAGQFVAEQLQGVENPVVIEIKGLLGTKPQEERHAGARKYIDEVPGVTVIEEVGNWLQDEGQRRMEDLLQAHPRIDAVYAHNDPMAVGAYLAARDAGRVEEMLFVGVDALGGPAGGIKKVMDGVLDCTFYYPTCAAEALELGVKMLRGEETPDEVILKPAQITLDNAQEWYDKATVD
jgi:ribose transport system substrate-binding protein